MIDALTGKLDTIEFDDILNSKFDVIYNSFSFITNSFRLGKIDIRYPRTVYMVDILSGRTV